jgi:hypothetical protein
MRIKSWTVLPASLAAVWLIACSGDEVTRPDEDVDSIIVSGLPSGILIVGDSARLIATAINATGGVVTNQTVAWRSSAPTVAAVRANGTVLAVGAGEATITATVGTHESTALLHVAYGGTVGIQGGVVIAAGGALTLTVPPSSLAQPALVLVRPATTAPVDPRVVEATAFEILPEGLTFSGDVTLAIKYDALKLAPAIASESLQLYTQSGPGWAVVNGSTVSGSTRTVTGVIRRAGVYAVRSTPVDRIVLRGAVVDGAVYSGQSAQLSALLYAATGDTLPQRTISWQTSDATKATIDPTGKVTGLGAGAVTISATTDGKSATTTITVLPRVVADWSGARDWVTFQADARHTGFVDVTVDATVFRERWVVSPVAGARFNPPTAGGANLFLSTDSYFGTQALLALSPTNGSVVWRRDFGSIFGINQPAYHSGTLLLTSGGHADTFLWAINETDGSLRFQSPFESQWERWTAPVVTENTVLTAGGYYGGMYGFDVTTGQRRFFLSGPQVAGWGPAASQGLAYRTGAGVKVVRASDGTVVSQVNDARLSGVATPVLGNANNLLTIMSGRLMSVDLTTQAIIWDQSGPYTGIPVTGKGVVYGFSGTGIAARRESDGSLLWTWTSRDARSPVETMVLTANMLFVSTAGAPGAVYGIDLASHMTVWSYPMSGRMALSSAGVLYIVSGDKVAAVSLR